jgi:hypothetical protein
MRTVATRKIVAFQFTVAFALYCLNSLEIFISPHTLMQEEKVARSSQFTEDRYFADGVWSLKTETKMAFISLSLLKGRRCLSSARKELFFLKNNVVNKCLSTSNFYRTFWASADLVRY